MATFTFTPDFGATKKQKPRVNAMSFGDGYEQRVTFGINTNPQVWDLAFANRTDEESQDIEDFLSARAGVESFLWTPYNESEARYICREWSKSIDRYNGNTITATFEQVFETV